MGCSYSKPKEIQNKYINEYKNDVSLENKVIAITGTTSGLGYITATYLLNRGATVICLNRDSERAKKAMSELLAIGKGTPIAITCDNSDFESVKSAANAIISMFPEGIDVLNNNAGVMALPALPGNKDGYDLQIATNHLGHFLLTKLLLPLLEKKAEKTGEARIVTCSSEARNFNGAPITAKYFEKNAGKLGGDGFWPRFVRYQQSKLSNAVFTYGLHNKLSSKGSKVKAVVVHPGLSATHLQVTSASSGLSPCILSMLMTQGQSAEDGTLSTIIAITDSKVNSGEFWGPTVGMGWMRGTPKLIKPEKICTDPASIDLLWKVSEAAIGESFVI
jgi:NAD(P)-dependent dehydrogenase (short-subunit alcohol dehydrogenase family)